MASSDRGAGFSTTKWLAIIGIGEDGLAGLGLRAHELLMQADLVFGGRRHLALASSAIRGEARPWQTPFDSAMREVLAARGKKVCVLASGDPFHFGVGTVLARHVDQAQMIVIPAASAFSLAAARLGWALNEVETVSLHGRPIGRIVRFLHQGNRILALTSNGDGPAQLAQLLASEGFGASRLHVLEALGGAAERVTTHQAAEFGQARVNDLNIVAIEVRATSQARTVPLGFGLDDALFAHDGQITKRPVRAATLSALSPRRGELLWDVGAGSGSISIEWLLAHPSMRAIAIEKNEERASRIGENATRFGVDNLHVVTGPAPQAFAGLEQPDAIFIGGGGSGEGVVQGAIEALRPGGRLVANAVTLEMEALLLALHQRLGGELLRLALAVAGPVGSMRGWRPAMPVTQFSWVKP